MKLRERAKTEAAPEPPPNTPEHECDHDAHVRIEEKLDRILALIEKTERS